MRNQFLNGYGLLNPIPLDLESDVPRAGVKLNHDRYEVFVNGEYVGRKVLLNEIDQVGDVGSFLRSRGFGNFTTSVIGDHYEVDVDGDEDAIAMKEHLRVYLQTR